MYTDSVKATVAVILVDRVTEALAQMSMDTQAEDMVEVEDTVEAREAIVCLT
jgi:hypothetical protein